MGLAIAGMHYTGMAAAQLHHAGPHRCGRRRASWPRATSPSR